MIKYFLHTEKKSFIKTERTPNLDTLQYNKYYCNLSDFKHAMCAFQLSNYCRCLEIKAMRLKKKVFLLKRKANND